MNKNGLIALGLSEEQATKVLEAYKGYVPPDRFNEVNEAKKAAEALVSERDKQLNELKKSTGNVEELQKQIETMQAENKATKQKYEADIKNLKINNAIDAALTANGAKNLKMGRAMLDLTKITVEGDEIKGIDDQIKALKEAEDSKFLFTDVIKSPAGMKAGEGGSGNKEKSVNEMSYDEMIAHLENGGTLD